MANIKVSALPALPSAITTGDLFYIVRTGISYKLDANGLVTSIAAAQTAADDAATVASGAAMDAATAIDSAAAAQLTATTALGVASAIEGSKVNRSGDDSVSGTLTVGSSKSIDQAGSGERVVLATEDGTQRAESNAVWEPGLSDTIVPGGDTWSSLAIASGSTRVLAFNPWATGSEVKYVAVSSSGTKFLYSLDRVTWSSGTPPSPNTSGSTPIGVACGIGPSDVVCWYATAIGLGGYTTLARSYDGIAWTSILTSPQLGHIAYGNGRWVIHNYNAATVRVSTDGGSTWNTHTGALANSESASLQYLGDRFVLGFTASLRAYVSFSADGVTWTTSAAVIGGNSTCKGAARSTDGTLIAAVSGGTSGLYRSVDNGATWTLVQSLTNVVSVTYFLGTFIAVQTSGAIYRSSDDGATWASVSSSLALSNVTFDNLRFIAVGSLIFASSAEMIVSGTDDVFKLKSGTIFCIEDHAGDGLRIIAADEDGKQTVLENPDVAGEYGSSTKTPTVIVDDYGRIASISEEDIDFPPAANGLPPGGTAGQVVAKIDGTDYHVGWVDPSGGGGGDSTQALAAVALLAAQIDATRLGVLNGWLDGFADTSGIASGSYVFSSGKLSAPSGELAAPQMTSNTEPSGTASASSEFSSGYAAWKAFNRTNVNEGDSWLPSSSEPPVWLRYQFPSATTVGSYRVTTRNYPAAYPTAWKLQGSNNGTDWTDLHEVTDSGLSSGDQTTAELTITSPGSYTHYRLYITARSSSADMGIGKLSLYAAPGDLEVVSTNVTGQTVESVTMTALVKGGSWTFEIDAGSGWEEMTTSSSSAGGGLTQHSGSLVISGTSVRIRAISTDSTAELHGWGVFW